MSLRHLVAGELYFNAAFYADRDVFIDTSTSTSDLSLDTVFTVALTAGVDEFSERGSKPKAIKSEALVACTRGKRSSFIHVLGLASVLSKQVFLMDPNVNFRF